MVSPLPIVRRELLVQSRSRATWWVRTIVAGTGCGIAFVMVVVASGFNAPRAGLTLHMILATLAWLFCLVEGVRHTISGLAEERRSGTLGLLFLSELRGYDLVLGRFVAAGLTTIYGVMGLLPPLAVPITLGGVMGVECWRLTIALGNTLLFSLSAGTLVSAVSRHELRAVLACMLAMLGAIFAPGLWSLFHGAGPAPALPCPWQVFYHSFAATYDASLFWSSNGWLFIVSLLMLAVSSLVLPHSWQEGGTKWHSRWTDRRQPGRDNTAPARRRQRAQWMEANPVKWLVLRDSRERRSLWALVLLACVAMATVWLLKPGDWDVAWEIFVGLQVVHFVVSCGVASAATRTLMEARQTGALELILATSMPRREIIHGLHLALRYTFARPVLVLVIAEVVLTVMQSTFHVSTGGGWERMMRAVLCVAISIAGFLISLFAVANQGMWMALTQRTASGAVLRTVFYALIMPQMLLPYFGWDGAWIWLSTTCSVLWRAQVGLNQELRSATGGQNDPPPVR